jgi:hypothetical protein
MDLQVANENALNLLRKSVSEKGFLASPLPKDNYRRIWARDGVITGMAALASREEDLIHAFKNTLVTLGQHISLFGNVPSNVDTKGQQISYGGLAGRADTGSWWLIGLCLYVRYTGDKTLMYHYEKEINQIHTLYQAWEYNNKDLIYVPLAGDWADEYILHGYVLYDQVLRYAALKLSGKLMACQEWMYKAENIKIALYENYYIQNNYISMGIHPIAKERLLEKVGQLDYLPASFHPAGYQNYFDALGNALAIILNLHPVAGACLDHAYAHFGKYVPAFSPVIEENDSDFNLLNQNFRFEFRNRPHEFHNGGVWPMINGFWGMALYSAKGKKDAEVLLDAIKGLNSKGNWEFNECFHGKTLEPCGVPMCTWSAAGQVLLENTLNKGFYLLD